MIDDDEINIKVGAIVVIKNDDDFLFLDPDDHLNREESIQLFWKDSIGVVIEIKELDKEISYKRIKLMVDGHTGWTYSDYLKPLS